MSIYRILLVFLSFICLQNKAYSTAYYVHPTFGNDTLDGTSRQLAFRTLERASRLHFLPGDQLLLASGETFHGGLSLIDQHGNPDHPITITTTSWGNQAYIIPSIINFKSEPNGILLEDCSFIEISNLQVTGNGFQQGSVMKSKMRCGVLIRNKTTKQVSHITLKSLHIFDVFFENEGFVRGKEEVRTANGTQRYGWGIRVMNGHPDGMISSINIEDCVVKNVSHTGIKLTGHNQHISNIYLAGNEVLKTGGPGIQMSEVRDVHVVKNAVSHSGSNDDTRKWGRGSGLWTWGSSRVLIEKNSFKYAKGPADSAGAHIDFNCDNIILQYNLSANNAGGFCEVLGNTYNCAYRYNVSINDGYRIKGVNGAFQEGKTLWLSGYQGQSKNRKGPVNFYFYNNTIYCADSLVAKIAIDNTSKGICIVNNIFYLKGGAKAVLGDQYKPDSANDDLAENVIFQNNLFMMNKANWPDDIGLKDSAPLFGDPKFKNGGGDKIEDYIPKKGNLIKKKGIAIPFIPNDSLGLWQNLHLEKDILGHPTTLMPCIGAIEPKNRKR